MFLSRAALGLILLLGAGSAFAQEREEPVNDGQDTLNPLNRGTFAVILMGARPTEVS